MTCLVSALSRLLLAAVAAAGFQNALAEQATPERVPLVRVLANPNEFEGREIITIGYATVEFENCALYLSREHALARDKSSSVWLPDSVFDTKKFLSGKWVMVKGVYSSNRIGTELYCGEFANVASIEPWPSE